MFAREIKSKSMRGQMAWGSLKVGIGILELPTVVEKVTAAIGKRTGLDTAV